MKDIKRIIAKAKKIVIAAKPNLIRDWTKEEKYKGGGVYFPKTEYIKRLEALVNDKIKPDTKIAIKKAIKALKNDDIRKAEDAMGEAYQAEPDWESKKIYTKVFKEIDSIYKGITRVLRQISMNDPSGARKQLFKKR